MADPSVNPAALYGLPWPTPVDLEGNVQAPALIFGSAGARTLHLVAEVDQAAALWGLARLREVSPPTVIVTGGVERLDWRDDAGIRRAIAGAERVVVHTAWQATPDTQRLSDAAYAAQVAAVRKLRAGKPDQSVIEWRPPEAFARDVTHFFAKAAESEANLNQQAAARPTHERALTSALSR